MEKNFNKQIIIAGCGIAGCFLGILLSKKGYKVTIYEKLSEKDSINAASNRSFNITFFGFGLTVLKENDLWDKILPHASKLTGSTTFLSKSRNPIVSKREKGSSPYFSVSRTDILNVLIKECRKLDIKIEFETSVEKINKSKKSVTVKNLVTNKSIELKPALIVGCDGVNSVVRESLVSETGSKITKTLSDWSYRQFKITNAKAKILNIKPNYANTWSDKDFSIVAFPNKDKSHTAIVITKGTKKLDLSQITDKFHMLEVFAPEFKKMEKDRPGRFATLHTLPWFYKDFIVIIGDAAHAFNPFFGQGVSAALGDAKLLADLIETENGLANFQKKRKIHMDALGELSKKGFKRYRRESRADYNSVYEKFESVLHNKFPKVFVKPVFDSITFDPGMTNNYVKAHAKQRKIFTFVGIPILARVATAVFSSIEERKLIII